MKTSFLAIILFYVIHVPSQAQEIKEEDLYDMSLEELMGLEITVASKTSESINDAPGIVTVISKKELEGFAASNLGEIMNRVISSSFLSANIFQDNLVDFRGQSFTPYNNHVLILINGRPLRDPISGGLNSTVFSVFPIETIKRLEIIRGPGSVLYGSCAYSGVINIITQSEGKEGTSANASVMAGSFNTKEYNFSTSIKNGDFNGTLGFTNLHTDGEEFEFTDYMGVDSSANFYRKTAGLFGSFEYKGLRFNGAILDFRPYSLGGENNNWSRDWGDSEHHTSYFGDIGYQKSIADYTDISVNLTNNRHTWHSDNGFIFEGEDLLGEITVHSRISENFNVIFGGTAGYENHESKYFRNGKSNFSSIYSQVDYSPVDIVKIIGGVQYNKVQDVEGNLSPRLGVIVNATDDMGLKLLYGQAFRKAYPLETAFDLSVLRGNPKLKPELINTFEAQLFYVSEKVQSSITGFYSRMSDIIFRQTYFTQQGDFDYLSYENGMTHDFYGVEWDLKWSISEKLYAQASANYQTNEDEEDRKNATLHPNFMMKGGLIYSTKQLNLGIYNSYFGEPTQVSDVYDNVLEINQKPSAYSILTAKAIVHLSEIIFKDFENEINFIIEGNNLFGEEVYYPEFTTKGVNSLLPLMTETGLFVRLQVKLR